MKHPHNRRGAKRILDYDQIRAMIKAGMQPKEIAEAVGSKRNYICKLKGKLGLIPDRWKAEAWHALY